MTQNAKAFQKGMIDGIPIMLGYTAVSFALGIAARNSGLNAFEATLMSLTNNTSAGEFAALELISMNASYFQIAVTQIIINLRYLLMSCALSQKLDPNTSFFHRLLIGFDVTDEIFGLSIRVPGTLNPFYTYGIILISMPGWATGTCLGVLMGNILPANVVFALSVALFAMFIAVIVPPAKDNKVLVGLILCAMAASLLFDQIPFLSNMGSGFKIILLTLLLAGGAAVLFPLKEEKRNAE